MNIEGAKDRVTVLANAVRDLKLNYKDNELTLNEFSLLAFEIDEIKTKLDEIHHRYVLTRQVSAKQLTFDDIFGGQS